MPAESVNERHHRDHHKPALPQVNQRRCHLEAPHGKALEDDSGDGQRPLDAKDGPAQRAAQRNQAEGRVGAGDEQIDGGVVENVKDVPRARPHQRVIERRADVDQHQRRGKDRATHHHPGCAARGCGDQVNRAHDRQHRADAVRDGIGQNVAQMVVGLHRLHK